MTGKQHPQWMHDFVREKYIPNVFGIKRIAKILGVSPETVRRWLDPEYAERSRQTSRERKRTYGGTCVDCGGRTTYKTHGFAKRCLACDIQHRRANKHWTREKVILAIQFWAYNHGRPPTSTEWLAGDGKTHPARNLVYGRAGVFKRWSDAIAAAGYPRPRPGSGIKTVNAGEARMLRKQGWSYMQIAEHFGVTTSAIYNHLGPQSKKQPPRRKTREQRIHDLRVALQREENQPTK